MATIRDLQEAMGAGLREKCINTILKDFRKLTREDAEDCVQLALTTAAFKIDKVLDIKAFVMNKAKLRAIDEREKEISRRALMPIHRVYAPRRRDPYRKLDWRIDLERAIKRSVKGTAQRNAAWLVFYEGYTTREVAQSLPRERTIEAWETTINRYVLPNVRRAMRRGGYRI